MKPISKMRLAVCAIAAITMSGQAALAFSCSPSGFAGGTTNVQDGLATLLSGNTACVATNIAAAPSAPWENQEYHSGGTIIEYGQGPSSANPPSTIGTYSTTSSLAPGGADTVTYSYAAGGSITFTVAGPNFVNPGAVYDFCPQGSSGPAIPVKVIAGQASCG